MNTKQIMRELIKDSQTKIKTFYANNIDMIHKDASDIQNCIDSLVLMPGHNPIKFLFLVKWELRTLKNSNGDELINILAR